MNMYVDDDTGCIMIDDIQEGVELLPTPLYQGYLKKIEDLKKEVSDLKEKVSSLGQCNEMLVRALADNSSALKNSTKLMEIREKNARDAGIAVGYFLRDVREGSKKPEDYNYVDAYKCYEQLVKEKNKVIYLDE